MIRRALSGEVLTLYSPGHWIRDYLHVQDAAMAFLYAGAGGHSLAGYHFVIGSGEGRSLREAFETISACVFLKNGTKVSIEEVDPPASLSPIDFRDFIANREYFSGRTGWRPGIPFEEGIRSTLGEMR